MRANCAVVEKKGSKAIARLRCEKSGKNPVEDGLILSCAEAFVADVIFDGFVPP